MSYIESHLHGDLSLSTIAREAYISAYHFHRLFSMVVGVPVAEFVRSVRLEAAAQQLRSTRTPIAGIARNVGYDSSDAFGRAFRKQFSEAPSAYRRRWRDDPPPLRVAPGLLLDRSIDPGVQVKRLSERTLACVRHIGAYQTVWQAWRVLDEWALRHSLDPHSVERIGISYDDPEMVPANRIRYDACLSVPATFARAVEGDQTIAWRTLAAGEFAIVRHRGPYHLLGEAYRRLYVHWLPMSGWTPRDEPSVELYRETGAHTEHDLITDIQLPVQRATDS